MVKCGEFALAVVFKSTIQAIITDIIISEREIFYDKS